VLDARTRVLILGSLPGDRSLAEGRYYAHPRNRFWPLMAALLNHPLPEPYTERLQMLLDHGTGLWDVAHRAIRPGSMDHAIADAVPNDIPALLSKHPGIKLIAFNGAKAARLFHRFFPAAEGVYVLQLPSTSPANASWSMDRLREAWAATGLE